MIALQPGNNAVLSGMKAMPPKYSTGEGGAAFAISRHEYAETVRSTPETVVIQTSKKWFGNRDASDVIARRRVREIGVGSLNASKGNMAFMNKNDQNARIDALARVRGGGYMVPPKVRNRPGQSGVPIITGPVHVPVIRSENRIAMIPTQQPSGKPYIPMKHVPR